MEVIVEANQKKVYNLQLAFEINEKKTYSSYGMGLNQYDGNYFHFYVYHHYFSTPWQFDIRWHTKFLDTLKNMFSQIILSDLVVILPIGENSEDDDGDTASDILCNQFIDDNKMEPPSWVKDPSKVHSCHFLKFNDLLKLFHDVSNQVNFKRKVGWHRSLSDLEYDIILFNSFDDQYALNIGYHWETGLGFEMPSLKIIMDDLKRYNYPKFREGMIPVAELENVIKLGLNFMQQDEKFDDVYELMIANLEKIRI